MYEPEDNVFERWCKMFEREVKDLTGKNIKVLDLDGETKLYIEYEGQELTVHLYPYADVIWKYLVQDKIEEFEKGDDYEEN